MELKQIIKNFILCFGLILACQTTSFAQLDKGRTTRNFYHQILQEPIQTPLVSTDLVLDTLIMELSLDFAEVDIEDSSLVISLTEKLSLEQIGELLNLSLSFRRGEIPYVDFYRYLKDLCKTINFRVSRVQP